MLSSFTPLNSILDQTTFSNVAPAELSHLLVLGSSLAGTWQEVREGDLNKASLLPLRKAYFCTPPLVGGKSKVTCQSIISKVALI